MKESTTVGLIKGDGIGREIIESALRCLQETNASDNRRLKFVEYAGPLIEPQGLTALAAFYQDVRSQGGVILRSSVPAPLCYALRRQFGLFQKLIFFRSIPTLTKASPLKESTARGIDLLLMRQNTMGIYHGQISEGAGGDIHCEQVHDSKVVAKFAISAFAQAAQRRKRIRLLLKVEVLGKLGEMWLEHFNTEAKKNPDVHFDYAPPDSGAAQILLEPRSFDVIAAPDLEADMLCDMLAVLIHGTRAVTPSVNMADDGFASYQTIHGTGKGLAKKDIANPAAMILAAALMLEVSLGMPDKAQLLRSAVEAALRDVVGENPKGWNNDLVLRNVRASHFTDLVLRGLKSHETRLKAA